MSTQTHIIDAGVDPEVLSVPVPDNACVNYDSCGNVIPGNGKMCGDCLDEVRHWDSSYYESP